MADSSLSVRSSLGAGELEVAEDRGKGELLAETDLDRGTAGPGVDCSSTSRPNSSAEIARVEVGREDRGREEDEGKEGSGVELVESREDGYWAEVVGGGEPKNRVDSLRGDCEGAGLI